MSADYLLYNPVPISKLLAVDGIKLVQVPEVPSDTKVISNGTYFIHVHLDENDNVTSCARYGGNDEDAIFELLENADIGWHAIYAG